MLKKIYPTWFLPVMVLLIIGCSDAGIDPVSPVFPGRDGERITERKLWGAWEITFDIDNLSADITAVRNIQSHYDVTEMLLPPNCGDCIGIDVEYFNTYTRILSADITLRNPAQVSGRDVRGILFTDDEGHELHNPDDWTGIWDIPGGEDINPFRAFAKPEDNRIFAGGAEHTENYLLKIPDPPKFASIMYAVDASWPGNCKEPYEIGNLGYEGDISQDASTVTLRIDVRDWQGDVDEVSLQAPSITGEAVTYLTNEGGDTWSVEYFNEIGVPPGDYDVWIIAMSPNPGDHPLYDLATLSIKGNPDSPVDVTPPYLNFAPYEVCIDGNYAYVPSGVRGLHVFDISDPSEPEWVSCINPGGAYTIAVEGNYAYTTETMYLHIIDITSPESPEIAGSVFTPMLSPVYEIEAKDGYVYMPGSGELAIADVNPPGSAYIVKEINTSGSTASIEIDGNYAYITSSYAGLYIVDITIPASAEIIKTFPIEGLSHRATLAVDGGYAYVVDSDMGMGIIDVDPPESTHAIQILDMPGCEYGVAVEDGVAYVTGYSEGLHMVDVSIPGGAQLINTLPLPIYVYRVSVSNGYVYTSDYRAGIVVADVDPPLDAHISGQVYTPGSPYRVVVEDGLAYVANVGANYTTDIGENLQIIDVTPGEEAEVVGYFGPMDFDTGLVLDGGYIYYGLFAGGFAVIDIQNPVNPTLVKIVETPGKSRGIDIRDGYAYVAGNMKGMHIVNIDPLASAHLVKTVDPSDEKAYDVCVDGGYAFVAYDDVGLVIMDIDPPEDAHVVKEVEWTYGGLRVVVDGGYAYVAGKANGLVIIDIDPVESAYIFNVVNYPFMSAHDVTVEDGYAYVAAYDDGLFIIDIDPVEIAHTVGQVDSLDNALGIAVEDGVAYVAAGGLRIIELW